MEGYWKTKWKMGATAAIEVTYTASGDPELKTPDGHGVDLITHHGLTGNDPAWQWADYDSAKMKKGLVVRSTLNGLRVKDMILTKGGDAYELCGAHRLNFSYHQNQDGSKGWGESTYASTELLGKMSSNGFATPSLFDPLGLVWLLL